MPRGYLYTQEELEEIYRSVLELPSTMYAYKKLDKEDRVKNSYGKTPGPSNLLHYFWFYCAENPEGAYEEVHKHKPHWARDRLHFYERVFNWVLTKRYGGNIHSAKRWAEENGFEEIAEKYFENRTKFHYHYQKQNL